LERCKITYDFNTVRCDWQLLEKKKPFAEELNNYIAKNQMLVYSYKLTYKPKIEHLFISSLLHLLHSSVAD